MKLIPNIQKELDALMADPLNYQDPNGILPDKDYWRINERDISDAFILLEASDFEIADELIASRVKTKRGEKLRSAYASVSKDLSEGRFVELEVETGRSEHRDYITPYYGRFVFNLRDSIDYRKSWSEKSYWKDFEILFPTLSDFGQLAEDLLEYADVYRKAAIKTYQSQREFEKALSDSAVCLQPFV